MKQKYSRYSIDELKAILSDRKNGVSIKDLSKKYNRTPAALYTVTSDYRLYIQEGKTNNKHMSTLFQEMSDEGVAEIFQYEVTTQESKIDAAVRALITVVIEAAQEKMAIQQKERESAIREKYEKELTHYQELLVLAQQSNMVGYIKKRMGLDN